MVVAVRNGVILIDIHGFDVRRGLGRYLVSILDQTGLDQFADSSGFGRGEGWALQYAGRTTKGFLAGIPPKNTSPARNRTYML